MTKMRMGVILASATILLVLSQRVSSNLYNLPEDGNKSDQLKRLATRITSGAELTWLTSSKEYVLTSSTNDLELEVGKNKSFLLKISKPLNEDFTVQFTYDNTGIVSNIDDIIFVAGTTNASVLVHGIGAGSVIISTNTSNNALIDDDSAFVRVSILHSNSLDVFSTVIGWIYFLAWSISFYPQIYSNWRRKSVLGLNFDFLILNITGFTLYGLYNIGLYWIPTVQDEYFEQYPKGINPVALNDVVFTLHAIFACILTIIQCFIYERGDQKVSLAAYVILGIIGVIVVVCLILGATAVVTWYVFLYICSYIKIAITLIKYIPQAWMNYKRKSTSGWSIGNVMLDFTGGILSISQMFVMAYNSDAWSSIFGDLTKFALGLFSVLFDILFMIQHYILYRGKNSPESLDTDRKANNSNGTNANGKGTLPK